MKSPSHRFVYGPVPSRRFGLSLGVDLLSPKTCCFDCIYCQLGPTARPTIDRSECAPARAVLDEIDAALARGPRPRVISIGGSGEPTLHGSLGSIIRSIRERTRVPVVLLTGGGLLFEPDVARDALEADILAPSLDAGDSETFLRVNRPHPAIAFDRMLDGLRDVCERFRGPVRVEVMLVPGVNDGEREIASIARCLKSIRHTAVDINTPVRPAPGRKIGRVAREGLERARAAFGSRAQLLTGSPDDAPELEESGAGGEDGEARVAALLARRPSTLPGMIRGLGLSRTELLRILQGLRASGCLEERLGPDGFYYLLKPRGRTRNSRRSTRRG